MNKTKVDKMTQEPVGPGSQAKKGGSPIVILLSAVGGVAMFVGVMVWYFTSVDRPPPSLPHKSAGADSSGGTPAGATNNSEALVMGAEVLDIVPASQSAINVKTGKAESVEVLEEAGLRAALEGNTVKITASPDAKEGIRPCRTVIGWRMLVRCLRDSLVHDGLLLPLNEDQFPAAETLRPGSPGGRGRGLEGGQLGKWGPSRNDTSFLASVG